MVADMSNMENRDGKTEERQLPLFDLSAVTQDSPKADRLTYEELAKILSSWYIITLTNRITDSFSDRFTKWLTTSKR